MFKKILGGAVIGAALFVLPAVSFADTSVSCTVDPTQSQCKGGSQPWCSSPTAPGYNVSLPGGGCNLGRFVAPGAPLYPGVVGASAAVCPFWFPAGCIVK